MWGGGQNLVDAGLTIPCSRTCTRPQNWRISGSLPALATAGSGGRCLFFCSRNTHLWLKRTPTKRGSSQTIRTGRSRPHCRHFGRVSCRQTLGPRLPCLNTSPLVTWVHVANLFPVFPPHTSKVQTADACGRQQDKKRDKEDQKLN